MRERRQALTWMAACYLHEGKTSEAKKKVQELRAIAQKGGDMSSVSGALSARGGHAPNTGSAAAAMEQYRKRSR